MDIFSKKKRSEIMSLIRSKNTGIEKEVFRYLRRAGINFRRHYVQVPGRPDVALPSKKRAVFIDADFWHGWRFAQWGGRLPSDFWKEKISSNIRRDKRNFALLRRKGWKVLRIWGHQLTGPRKDRTLERVRQFLSCETPVQSPSELGES